MITADPCHLWESVRKSKLQKTPITADVDGEAKMIWKIPYFLPPNGRGSSQAELCAAHGIATGLVSQTDKIATATRDELCNRSAMFWVRTSHAAVTALGPGSGSHWTSHSRVAAQEIIQARHLI